MRIEDIELNKKNTQQSGPDGFLYPQYGQNCISDIPNAILNLFKVETQKGKSQLEEHIEKSGYERINNVVLIVLDGFGFNQFSRYHQKYRFFAKIAEEGKVFPITSVFPSQTTNALTTLNTGLSPQEHSVFEYFIYLKEAGMVVDTLWFEHIDSNYRIKLLDKGFHAEMLFDGKTIHETLRENGIKAYAHIPASSAYSVCSSLIFKGSKVVPAVKISDTIVGLRKNLEKCDGSAYFFVHLDTLDTIAHVYGPNSYEYEAELSMISYLLNKELIEKVSLRVAKETLILVTADHGSVDVDPKETIYLNHLPKVIENLQCGGNGERILPTGSPRDIFLHVREEKLAETRKMLSRKLAEKAQVIETKEAIKNGLFGIGDASEKFLERAGNLLLLPYGNETIWIECSEGRRANFLGYHGGLSEEEMLVPFAIAKLGSLK